MSGENEAIHAEYETGPTHAQLVRMTRRRGYTTVSALLCALGSALLYLFPPSFPFVEGIMSSSIPPTSPSSSRNAARHLERSHRVMGSPENRRSPTNPSTNSLGVQPVDLSTRLSSIPPPQHNGPQASTSAFTLAPPPIITSMAAPAPPPRQTLSSTQLRAAFAALPPLNPPNRRQPVLTSALDPSFRFIDQNVCI